MTPDSEIGLLEDDDAPAPPPGGSEAIAAVPDSRAGRSQMRWGWFVALIFVPALWHALIVFQYGVNIPYFDEWTGLSPMFESMNAGTLGIHDFTAQHNEHRLPIPRLVFFAAALLTHWDTRAEMVLTWLAILGMAACVWKLLGATGGKPDVGTSIVFAALGLLLFDPLQEQNIIDGFQFHFVLPVTLILAAFVAALTLRHPWQYIVSAALATAATFSMALGVGAWGLIFPLFFLKGLPPAWKKWTAFWFGAAAINLILFSIGYQLTTHYGSIFQHPGDALYYFVVYLGSPFSWGTALMQGDASSGVGVALLCALAAALFWLWLRRADALLLRRAIPWLMVAGIGLLHGALTTYGRFHMTFLQAMETRYVTYAVLVPIGLIALFWILSEHEARNGISWPRSILLSLGSMLFLLHVLGVIERFSAWPVLKQHRLMRKAIVQFADVVEKPEFDLRVTPEPPRFRNSIHILTHLGYLTPPPLTSNLISEIANANSPGDPGFGKLEQGAQDKDKIAMKGWAILPERLEPANGVIITRDNAQGAPIIVDLIDNMDKRVDVVFQTQEPGFVRCGWHCVLSIGGASQGGVLKAWAYDAESRRAWRLAGSLTIHP